MFLNYVRVLTADVMMGISVVHAAIKHAPLGKPKSSTFKAGQDGPYPSSAPIAKALIDHFITQFNTTACSVASVAMVLNAARAHLGLSHLPEFTQHQILNDVKAAHWKNRVSGAGHNGRRGLPVETLGKVVVSAFDHYGIPYRDIKTVPLLQKKSDLYLQRKKLYSRLNEFETLGDSLIIAHFNQGLFIKGLHLPHISPVGAFDIKRNQVLILDVDPHQVSPYWVSFDAFFEGLAWSYGRIMKLYGYGGGGYVWIRLM